MYLKSIEVQGFKSFANKINFKFHNGITGIVGPNGSGKSNVADAVRWVLGEQRVRQLRGASMQDVIFSGTETRKPLSYAYVAITLDNSEHDLAVDYDEVTVARRIYRSGESEYSLNGTICRLKDVNELFYDTGVGKEGYSIIGQGQIDRILSGKPEDRRELFDEAAGIVKFKRRKNTAQKKLEEEKQNLLRIKDILGELEKQIGPLERQSEKAKTYLKKKEELKTLDVNMFLLEHEHMRGQLGEAEEKCKIAEGELEETNREYGRTKEEYERIQSEMERLEASIEKARTGLTDTGVLRGKLEGQINVLKEQINSAKGNERHLQSRQQAVGKEIEEKENDKSVIIEEKKSIDERAGETEAARREAAGLLAQLQSEIEAMNSRIETGKNIIIQALNERAAIRSRMERFDTMLEQANARKGELHSRLSQARSYEEEQKAAIDRLKEEFEAVNVSIREMTDSQAVLEERLGQMKTELAQKDKNLRDRQVAYHQEKSRLEALSSLTERYEGYGVSVKRVMEQKDVEKGIVGVMADIIKVDRKYETAIETAFGANIQNIVTEDEDTARRMIDYLKKIKGGRATFLPLTSIREPGEFKNKEALSEKGVIGLADSLIHVDRKYANAVKYMVGKIVVTDNVEHALKLAGKYGYRLRIVTLEGELLVPGGAISGGTFKNNASLLGRRREMEELQAKVKGLLTEIDGLLNAIQDVKEERNQVRRQLEETRISLQEKFIAQNTARLNIMAAEEKKNETEEGYGSLQGEQEELDRRIEELTKEREKTARELLDSHTLEETTQTEIREYQNELEKKRLEESAQTASVSEWEVEAEKYRQQQEFKQQNIDRIQGEVVRLTEELGEIQEGIEKNEREIARKQQDITEIELTIVNSNTAQGNLEEQLKTDLEKKETLGAKQKSFFSVREELSARQADLDKEVYRLHAQKEKLEAGIESQINYMWDEYEITFSGAMELRDKEMTNMSEMRKQISGLKEQIRALGDVNVNAIEDYKNLMERYDFLKGQHDDLVEAEQTLLTIIEELDASMRKQFHEKFGLIGREFDKVFKELFGGGKGTLELMEDEDILEAGIRIIAQPPGKKLQNMMQLSGGEKALTAIALLFAIQNLKPSPFCLLDEIEAALDENNVGRFARYLHKLTKHTQFIVITHRRGTMEKADRLYGITMQEKGISTLVSVNLIDSQLEG